MDDSALHADCFPLCRHRQAAVCIKCVVGIHYGSRATSYWRPYSSVVSFHLTRRRLKLSGAQPTGNCWKILQLITHMFHVNSWRHCRGSCRTTISADEAITLNNVLHDAWRISLLTDCYYIKQMLYSDKYQASNTTNSAMHVPNMTIVIQISMQWHLTPTRCYQCYCLL